MSHLILHKVRGEPAFDIASQMEVDDEVWWIIPTSGHRAYPYATWRLEDILLELGNDMGLVPSVPADWPDHYQVTSKPPSGFNIMAAISGLLPKVRRRV